MSTRDRLGFATTRRRSRGPIGVAIGMAMLLGTGIMGEARTAAEDAPARIAGQSGLMQQDGIGLEIVGQIGGATWAVAVDPGAQRAYLGLGPRLLIVDVSNPERPTVLGQSAVLPDVVMGIAVDGDLVYLANGTEGGLCVVDVRDPANPSLLGVVDTPGDAQGVAVAGTVVLVADRSTGLLAYDVADPSAPRFLDAFDTPGAAHSVTVEAGLAYVADEFAGLQIIDVSDPSDLRRAGEYDTPDWAHGVTVEGSLAYVADRGTGVVVLDVSNPNDPRLLREQPTGGDAYAVAVAGDRIFVAAEAAGVRVFDAPAPGAMQEIYAIDTPGSAHGLVLADGYAYVADHETGLRIIHVGRSIKPSDLGTRPTSGAAHDVALDGPYAYVADGTAGLQVIDVSDPSDPFIVTTFETEGEAWAVVVDGRYAYVAAGDAGLQIVDIGNPDDPIRVGQYRIARDAHGIAVAGGYAYLADGDAGLRVIDVRDPSNPRPITLRIFDGFAHDVIVADDLLYVAAGDEGLIVASVSNPASPVVLDTLEFFGASFTAEARGVAATPGLAFVAIGNAGLAVVDASNPNELRVHKQIDTPHLAEDVAIAGTHAYVADRSSVRVMDVRVPGEAYEITFIDTPGLAEGVAMAGRLVAVAARSAGLRVIEASPRELGIVDWLGPSRGLALADGRAFVATGPEGGLRVLDVAQPSAPRALGGIDTPGAAEDVAVESGLAYVADGEAGLQVFDIADPGAPRLVDAQDTPGHAGAVALVGRYGATARKHALVADGEAGLQVIEASNPADLRLGAPVNTSGHANQVTVAGDWALVADGGSGIQLVDVADPDTARPIGNAHDTLGDARAAAVAGSYAFVADGNSGLRIVDFRDAGRPREMAELPSSGFAGDVAVLESLAFVAEGEAGLRAYDVGDRQEPTELASLNVPEGVEAIALAGGKVYMAAGDAGLVIAELSLPSRIAFESDRFGQFDIFSVKPDGTDLRRLTNHSATDAHAAWSPDGRRIAFTSNRDGNYDLYVMDADGGNLRRLTNDARYDGEANWSPDGSQIVFHSDRGDQFGGDLYILGVDNGELIEITNNQVPEYGPEWSPDGHSIVFVEVRERHVLCIMDRNANNRRCITPNLYSATQPSWSPDGATITFTCRTSVLMEPEVCLVNPDGSNFRMLAEDPAADHEAAWSPDGARIAFHSERIGRGDVFVVGADDSGLRNLSANASQDWNPSWGVARAALPPTITPPPTSSPSASATRGSTPTPSLTPSASPSPRFTATATATRVVVPPLAWPVPPLVERIRTMVTAYYNREAEPGTPGNLLAPISEGDKTAAAKDPDTLWETLAQLHPPRRVDEPSPACHAARTAADFVNCTGARIALTKDMAYAGGLSLFQAPEADADHYYANDATVQIAGRYALYHAFARDFDAPRTEDYAPTAGRAPRDHKRYHERMIRAYEAHMRNVLFGMLSATRSHAHFQHSLTRGAGLLLMPYARTVQTMEEYGAWADPEDRKSAVGIINALTQRIWWEWVAVQREGPRTAGKAPLGSHASFEAALGRDPRHAGADQFELYNRSYPSLRDPAIAGPPYDGLWFDADYTLPGESWCSENFDVGGTNWNRCMALARRESLEGDKSPFGQYFGRRQDCSGRARFPTNHDCGETNLGSIAEEWLWTYVGARSGLRIVEQMAAGQDPQAPRGIVYPVAYDTVTERLGYGVAGFDGGASREDDLEWTFVPDQTHAIRTLSAGRRDGEQQYERFSLGERDILAGRTAIRGDTWPELDEYPGGMENHVPGPNPFYGAFLGMLVLSDKVDGGMSGSLYDAEHRNRPDEFLAWAWLLQATFYRCPGVEDPADPACFAFSPAHAPRPPAIKRQPLFFEPSDARVPPAMRYLWRDDGSLVSDALVADGDLSCNRGKALAFAEMPVYGTADSTRYLLTEYGYGAYGLLLQGGGAFMRLAAARSAEPVPEGFEAEYAEQRSEVLEPWHAEMQRLVGGILDLFGEGQLGYIPDIENAQCAAGDGVQRAPVSWRAAGATPKATMVRRAHLYSAAAQWYWWYQSDWLDIDTRWQNSGPR